MSQHPMGGLFSTSSLLKCSLTWFFSTKEEYISLAPDLWPVLLLKTEIKMGFSTSDIPVLFITSSSSPVGACFPQPVFFCCCTHQSHPISGLGSPNPIPAELGSISVFFLVHKQAEACSPETQGCDSAFCLNPFGILSTVISWSL